MPFQQSQPLRLRRRQPLPPHRFCRELRLPLRTPGLRRRQRLLRRIPEAVTAEAAATATEVAQDPLFPASLLRIRLLEERLADRDEQLAEAAQRAAIAEAQAQAASAQG